MSADVSPTQQTIILIALATSSLMTVQDQDLLPELKADIDEGVERMLKILEIYPADNTENLEQTEAIMQRVSKLINKPDTWFSVETVVFLGLQICTDLLAELCNPKKRALVNEAFQYLKLLDDHLDPEGENEDVFNEVDEILKEVYKEIGFVRDLRYLKRFKKLQRKATKHGRSAR